MLATHASERALTASCDTSRRQGLSAGKSGQPAIEGPPTAAADGRVVVVARRVVVVPTTLVVVAAAVVCVVDAMVGTAPCLTRAELLLHATSSARSALAQQPLRDDNALDLVRAFVDLGDLGVTHEALDRELLGVAVAAEQ